MKVFFVALFALMTIQKYAMADQTLDILEESLQPLHRMKRTVPMSSPPEHYSAVLTIDENYSNPMYHCHEGAVTASGATSYAASHDNTAWDMTPQCTYLSVCVVPQADGIAGAGDMYSFLDDTTIDCITNMAFNPEGDNIQSTQCGGNGKFIGEILPCKYCLNPHLPIDGSSEAGVIILEESFAYAIECADCYRSDRFAEYFLYICNSGLGDYEAVPSSKCEPVMIAPLEAAGVAPLNTGNVDIHCCGDVVYNCNEGSELAVGVTSQTIVCNPHIGWESPLLPCTGCSTPLTPGEGETITSASSTLTTVTCDDCYIVDHSYSGNIRYEERCDVTAAAFTDNHQCVPYTCQNVPTHGDTTYHQEADDHEYSCGLNQIACAFETTSPTPGGDNFVTFNCLRECGFDNDPVGPCRFCLNAEPTDSNADSTPAQDPIHKVHFDCHHCYVVDDPLSTATDYDALCDYKGTGDWATPGSMCVFAECDNPPWAGEDSVEYLGAATEYLCDEEYEIVCKGELAYDDDTTTRTYHCNGPSGWSPSIAETCEECASSAIPIVDHATYTRSGSQVTYTCDDGYAVKFMDDLKTFTITCLADITQAWETITDSCVKECTCLFVPPSKYNCRRRNPELEEVPVQCFKRNGEDINELDLSHNNIEVIDREVMKGFLGEHFDVSDNDIVILPDDTLIDNENLDYFDITDNKLTTIGKSLFNPNVGDVEFRMRDNPTKSLWEETFDPLKEGSTVWIDSDVYIYAEDKDAMNEAFSFHDKHDIFIAWSYFSPFNPIGKSKFDVCDNYPSAQTAADC